MRSSTKGLLALVGLGLGALLVYREQRTDRQLAEVTRELDALAKTVARPSVPAAWPMAAPVDSDAIAARVAQRLGPRGAVATATPAASLIGDATTNEPREPTPAAQAAQSIVESALGRGQLAVEDVRKMRRELANARPEERHEIARQIAVAINLGKIQPQDMHEIFP